MAVETKGWRRAIAEPRTDGRNTGTLRATNDRGEQRTCRMEFSNNGSAIIHTRNPNGVWTVIHVDSMGRVSTYGVGSTDHKAYLHLREQMGGEFGGAS